MTHQAGHGFRRFDGPGRDIPHDTPNRAFWEASRATSQDVQEVPPSLPSTAVLAPGRGGQPRLLVDAPAGSAEVYLHGATVTSWTPRGGREVIFTSRRAVFDGRTAIRGGVPLCLPAFSTGIHGDASPRHGWARISPWRLMSATATRDKGVRALFVTSQDHLTALYEVEVGEVLSLTLSLRNDADLPRTVEAALHTYLAVHDVTASEVSGLEGDTYTDGTAPSGGAGTVQRGAVRVSGPVDRIYRSVATVRVTDPGNQRVIVVRKSNAPSTIVWNPWSTYSVPLADMADDEFPSMLCVESGAVRQDAPVIMPGASWSMRALISTEPAEHQV